MKRQLIAYAVMLVLLPAIDFAWIGGVARGLYQGEIGALLAPHPRLVPAVIFYVLYAAGLLIFVVAPGLDRGDWRRTIGMAALFGLIAYSVYDLTNLSVALKGFTTKISLGRHGLGRGDDPDGVVASLGRLAALRLRLARGQRCVQLGQTLLQRAASGVDDDTLARPGLVFALFDLGPGGRDMARDVGDPGLDPAPVFGAIRTDHLDLDKSRPGGFGDGAPSVAGDLDRIDRVPDHGQAEPQIVGRQRKGQPITQARIVAIVDARVGEHLLDGVDAQMRRTAPARQLAGHGAFCRRPAGRRR